MRVSITAPDGMAFTSFDSRRLSLDGDRLIFEGTPSGDLDLEASFAPSLPVRIWRTLDVSGPTTPEMEEQAPEGLFRWILTAP